LTKFRIGKVPIWLAGGRLPAFPGELIEEAGCGKKPNHAEEARFSIQP
jgi:hypothetical protein